MSITDALNGIAPPPTRWNVLSLGAGVQSSTLALMASHGEVGPMPDFAVFADTQAEPKEVYDWLNWLETKLAFPLYRVTAGSLADVALQQKTTKDGRRYTQNMVPAYTDNPDGSKGMVGRQCTNHFKIIPIHRETKRRCGIRRAQKEVTVTQWIGISFDEIQRMKPTRDAWQQNRWPLVERQMRRQDCLKWMADFSTAEDNGQQRLFGNECEGMCGV